MKSESALPTLGWLDWFDRLWALTLRELRSFFSSPVPWIATTVFLALNGVLFVALIQYYTQQSAASVAGSQHLFQFSMFLLTFLCPALTMQLLASEHQNRTLEALLTAPVTDAQVAISKFLGAFIFYLAMLASIAIYLLILGSFGDWELGPIAASFFGLTLIGGLFLSFGVLASSLTKSQLVAFLVGFLFDLSLVYGLSLLHRFIESPTLKDLIGTVTVDQHFQEFARGIVHSGPVVFYLSSIVLFLFLTVRSLESRTWR